MHHKNISNSVVLPDTHGVKTQYTTVPSDFTKSRMGTPFFLGRRPGYDGQNQEDISNYSKSKPIPIPVRKGPGNSFFRRPGAIKQPPLARQEIDFQRLQLLDVENNGLKVQLGDKTLKHLFQTSIPDPTDITFAAEGRPQRTINKTMNFAQLSLATVSVSDKLEAMKNAIENGLIQTTADIKSVMVTVQDVLQNTRDIEMLNQKQRALLFLVINELKIPNTFYKFDATLPRFVSKDYYLQNIGAIQLWLLKFPTDSGDMNQPVWNAATTRLMRLSTMSQKWSKLSTDLVNGNKDFITTLGNDLVLDLQERSLIPILEAMKEIDDNKASDPWDIIDSFPAPYKSWEQTFRNWNVQFATPPPSPSSSSSSPATTPPPTPKKKPKPPKKKKPKSPKKASPAKKPKSNINKPTKKPGSKSKGKRKP